jgi:hypothetical protein
MLGMVAVSPTVPVSMMMQRYHDDECSLQQMDFLISGRSVKIQNY